MARRLDRTRPFGTITPPLDGAYFEQDGRLFAGDGRLIGADDAAAESAPIDATPVIVVKPTDLTPAEVLGLIEAMTADEQRAVFRGMIASPAVAVRLEDPDSSPPAKPADDEPAFTVPAVFGDPEAATDLPGSQLGDSGPTETDPPSVPTPVAPDLEPQKLPDGEPGKEEIDLAAWLRGEIELHHQTVKATVKGRYDRAFRKIDELVAFLVDEQDMIPREQLRVGV